MVCITNIVSSQWRREQARSTIFADDTGQSRYRRRLDAAEESDATYPRLMEQVRMVGTVVLDAIHRDGTIGDITLKSATNFVRASGG